MLVKRVVFMVLAVLLVLSAAGCGGNKQQPSQQQQTDKVNLGVIQILEHPALDAARNGFLDVFAENGYKDGEKLVLDYQNAQGQQDNLQTIADNKINLTRPAWAKFIFLCRVLLPGQPTLLFSEHTLFTRQQVHPYPLLPF